MIYELVYALNLKISLKKNYKIKKKKRKKRRGILEIIGRLDIHRCRDDAEKKKEKKEKSIYPDPIN
jgi:hypothetical protein